MGRQIVGRIPPTFRYLVSVQVSEPGPSERYQTVVRRCMVAGRWAVGLAWGASVDMQSLSKKRIGSGFATAN